MRAGSPSHGSTHCTRCLLCCLQLLADPLKALSHSQDGLVTADPWGNVRRVFPFLLSYVADLPEAKDITGIKDTQSTQRPCILCYVSVCCSDACCEHALF